MTVWGKFLVICGIVVKYKLYIVHLGCAEKYIRGSHKCAGMGGGWGGGGLKRKGVLVSQCQRMGPWMGQNYTPSFEKKYYLKL